VEKKKTGRSIELDNAGSFTVQHSAAPPIQHSMIADFVMVVEEENIGLQLK
jgi:hypothetical protein